MNVTGSLEEACSPAERHEPPRSLSSEGWISSIELENIAVGHPDVAEAAVIGIAHPKWDERPLLIIVRNEGSSTDGPEILDFMKGKIASWWMPDDVTFVEEIPHTATGKIQKLRLREQFSDYILPTA